MLDAECGGDRGRDYCGHQIIAGFDDVEKNKKNYVDRISSSASPTRICSILASGPRQRSRSSTAWIFAQLIWIPDSAFAILEIP